MVPGRPFSSPFPFSRRPPSRPCRRHFPRFLLPLQSGGREGAAALSCLQTSSGTHRGRPGTAPGTSSAALLQSPGGGTSPRGTGLGSPSCPRSSSPPGLVPAATAPGLSFVLDADPRPSPSGPGVNAVIAGPPAPRVPSHALPPTQRGTRAAAPARGRGCGSGCGRAALPLAGAGQLAHSGLPARPAGRPVALRRGHLWGTRGPGGRAGSPHRRAAPPPRRPACRHRAPGPPASENP